MAPVLTSLEYHVGKDYSIRTIQIISSRLITETYCILKLLLACYCLNFTGTFFVVQCGKSQSSGHSSRPKSTSTTTATTAFYNTNVLTHAHAYAYEDTAPCPHLIVNLLTVL